MSGVRIYVDEDASEAGPSRGGAGAAETRLKGKGRKRSAPLEDVSDNSRSRKQRTRGPAKVHPGGGEKAATKVRERPRRRTRPPSPPPPFRALLPPPCLPCSIAHRR